MDHKRDSEIGTSHHTREEDVVTRKVKLFIDIVQRVGFPIVVCIWLAYRDFTQGREMLRAVNEFKEVVLSLKVSIDQQTKVFRRRSRDD